MLHAINISSETLQDLHDDNASQGKGFGFLNHSPQFITRAAGRGTEKIDPDGSVNQDHARFRRKRLRSPFQIPLP